MAEKVDIWMPFYPADYLASTMHLTCEESGAYLHLLFHSWKVGPLPKDTEQLRRIARVEKKPWAAVWSSLRSFWQETEAGLVQSRLERERVTWAERKEMNVAKAKAAVAAREAKRLAERSSPSSSPGSSTRSSPRSHQDHAESIPSSSSLSTSLKTPPTPSQASGPKTMPLERVDRAKHVASERTVGMFTPTPTGPPERSPEEQALLEREVDELFAKPNGRESRRPGSLERVTPPANLSALRQHLSRPVATDAKVCGRAMLQHLFALFQAQFNKPTGEGDGWEDSLAAWNRCFEPVSVGDVEMDGDRTVVYLVTPRPRDLADGLTKFQHKVRAAMKQAFGREVQLVPRDAAVAA